jgi:predicted DNA-binding transcriptional regulator AlpA
VEHQQIETDWDRRTVCKFFGGTKPLNSATLYRGIKAGRYPKPYHPSPGLSRWVPSECRAAREALIAARD